MQNRSPKDYWFVGIQFTLFFAFLFNFPYSIGIHFWVKYLGLGIAILGLAIVIIALFHLDKNLTAFPTPKVQSELITSGLYAFMRHPIYSGILLTVFGFSAFSDSIYRLIISFSLLVLFYFKTNYEEKKLKNKYPEYSNYKAKTGRFLPRF
ncbi:isoprenylcysteine carboxylmethyltransferase family protein [Lacihabitans sp. LS3-19]|uniref:methyltransferase family protein n=1 Tax=Lacihabitans sp. LS3-19 TaxID=2487335 RepID=UPI0020CBEA72|nr:isoprenylcysteine carboxylmethyltransferase family protein [Lacihabitans sp. LS3-19]MCP9768588.1 isoprenylcysteine carboxylmethyltransferase family protein [Lacihabitans sp. LS3-19]